LRNEEDAEDEVVVDRAGEVEGRLVAVEGLLAVLSDWVGGVSLEGCGLFFPEDGGEGGLGMVTNEC
jgi:hypothetical protein